MPATSGQPSGGQGSLTIPPGGKTSKGNALNVSQLATGPKSGKRKSLVHAQSADRSLEVSLFRPEGEGVSPILRWLCWMTEVVQGFWQLLNNMSYLHQGAQGGL